MDDKTSLLEQLRIDRSSDRTATEPRRWPIWLGAALVVIAILAFAAWFWLRPRGVPVKVAVVRDVSTQSGGHIAAASALDASGYVVARRQATVSAKTIGEVLEVLMEEGQHVAGGQVLARLDDSNTRARLEQARAQIAQSEASLRPRKSPWLMRRPIYQRMQRQSAAALISAQDSMRPRRPTTPRESHYDVAAARRRGRPRGADGGAARQDDTVVRAPFTGVVTVKAAQPGEMVSPISAGGGFTRTGIGTHRRHGLARGRSGRQRELHQPGACRTAGDREAQCLSGLGDSRRVSSRSSRRRIAPRRP